LEPIVYESGRIASEGSLVLDALGGKTEVSKIGITDLLSPVPALGLQVRFSEISLAQLTSAVSVGHITGVIEGGIDDLVVVKGQPVSMSARVNTVARKGVSQTISVTALNQISVLGGSGSNAISRSIVGLFDQYKYKKMGFSCSLANDRFTLRGVETASGKDLLVVGSLLPPTVNVVSHSQVIAFSEMMRRLTRVRETEGPTTQESTVQ
jgi:hypothetical protein